MESSLGPPCLVCAMASLKSVTSPTMLTSLIDEQDRLSIS